jgi:hypothetical protein
MGVSQMSHNPIGLHIQAGGLGDRAGLIEHCKRASYKTLTVLDDFTLAMDLTDALPEATVVFRQFEWEPAPPNNGQLGQLLSGQPQHDPRWKRVVINVNCEQGHSLDRSKMYADMIEEASALGIRLPSRCCAPSPSIPNIIWAFMNTRCFFLGQLRITKARPGVNIGIKDRLK